MSSSLHASTSSITNQEQASPSHRSQRAGSLEREMEAALGETAPPSPVGTTAQGVDDLFEQNSDIKEENHQSSTLPNASESHTSSLNTAAEVGSRAQTADKKPRTASVDESDEDVDEDEAAESDPWNPDATNFSSRGKIGLKTPPKAHLDKSDADADEEDGAESEASSGNKTHEAPDQRGTSIKKPPTTVQPATGTPVNHGTTGGKSFESDASKERKRKKVETLHKLNKEALKDELGTYLLNTEGSKSELLARLLLYLCGLHQIWHKRCVTLLDDFTMQELRDLLKEHGKPCKGKKKPEVVSWVVEAEDELGLFADDDEDDTGSIEQAPPSPSAESNVSSRSSKRKSEEISDPQDEEHSPAKRRKSGEMEESELNAFINGEAGGSSTPSPTPRVINPMKKRSAVSSPPAGPSPETKKALDDNAIVTNCAGKKPTKSPRKPTSSSKPPRMTKPPKSIATERKPIKDEIGWDYFVMADGQFDSRIFFEGRTPTPEVLHALFHIMTGHPQHGDFGILHAFRLRLRKYKAYLLNPGLKDFKIQKWLNTQKLFESRLPG